MTQYSSLHIQQAADIFGSKWTPLIIAELADAPKRFSEIERSIHAINPRTLSKRLDELRSADIVSNCVNDPDYSDLCYRLTDKGHDLLPILREMSKWGQKHPRSRTWNIS